VSTIYIYLLLKHFVVFMTSSWRLCYKKVRYYTTYTKHTQSLSGVYCVESLNQ